MLVERFKVHINDDTYGWISPYERGVPEKWPVDCGFLQAHETVAEHVTGSLDEETGFVAVITEVSGSAVAVPESWTRRFPSYEARYGRDFPSSLFRPTGKRDAVGKNMLVWHDYVTGTDPTDESDVFRASIVMKDGTPTISTLPELSDEEKAKRKFTLLARVSLMFGDWVEIPVAQARDYNFFKVRVEMR